MPVTFDGKALVPGPFVQYNVQPRKLPNGRISGFDTTFNLTGTIVNVDSTLDSSGAIDATRMQGVLLGQAYIKDMFDVETGLLEISAPETSSNKITAYCQPTNLAFNNGTWVNRCDYSIDLFSNNVSGLLSSELESISENWSVTETEHNIFTIVHTIEAKGLLVPSGGGFNNPLNAAKAWVRSRAYTTSTDGVLSEVVSGSGVMNLSNMIYALSATSGYWNRQATETVDPINYTWSLVENFVHSSGTNGYFTEDFSVTINQGFENPDKAEVNVNGTIFGYANNIRNYQGRLKNASGAFASTVLPNIYVRAQNYVGGFTVNPIPLSRQVIYESVPGSVRYNYSYVAFSGATYVSGAIDESISVVDTGPTDVFASIDVPGRAKGPIIQYMNTRTLPERTININATVLISSSGGLSFLRSRYLSKPNVSGIIEALKPEAGYYYITQNSEDWNPIQGNYSRTVSWIIDPPGSGNESSYTVQGTPYTIHEVNVSGI